jgi:hypothetical protein
MSAEIRKLMVLVEETRFNGEEGTPSELGDPRNIAVDEGGRRIAIHASPLA